ncbi:MAG TPA: hypothetical protein DDW90_02315 [Cyanobacteria bacterium UBA9971]|nr:hypothetical protein [Cyanobacteria bacterium UBA9971]
MLKHLNQTNFPFLWKIFQLTVGGTCVKRQLSTQFYNNEKNILEVGCSLGNVSRAFVKFPNINFKGIDIDPVVIDYAKKDFKKYKNFEFECQDISTLFESSEKYDYILLCGLLHHINDEEVVEMLRSVSKILNQNGKIVIVDILLPEINDNLLYKMYVKLDKGHYIRKYNDLNNLIMKTDTFLNLIENNLYFVGGTPIFWPKCARAGLYVLNLK